MVTLVIVDDDEGFRTAARRLLEAAGFRVVGEACNGESAAPLVSSTRPQAVLVDIQLPGSDGFEVTRSICSGDSPPLVVLVSGRDPRDYVAAFEQSGAIGFIDKAELSAPLLTAILEGAS